jgi:hypothetical protein
LAQINQQITSIEEGIAADQKRAQEEQRRIREQAAQEASQAFLQQQEDARTRAQRQVTLAEDTPQLADDIRRQEQLRDLITRQIAALKAAAVDEKDKQAAIRQLRAERDRTTDELRDLRRSALEQQAQARQAALDQIAENLSLRTQIAETRGDKDAILAALNAEIANQRKRVAAAKKARQGVLKEQLALEQLLKQRRDLNKQVSEDAQRQQGLSVADILRENAETFIRTGGNLINGQQPFAGPTGFTADVAQFLTRGPTPQIEVVAKDDKTGPQFANEIRRLIEALDRNTEARGGVVPRSRNDRIGDVVGARYNAMASFYTSRQARQLTEAENQ